MRIGPAARIAGELLPPPDKSISHRAALLAAMSDGEVQIRNYLRSADTGATLAAVSDLGAELVERRDRDSALDLVVKGAGLRGARERSGTIDVANAGTLLRLLPGWLAGQPRGLWTLDGDESIRRRPVDRIVEPLRLMGAAVDCRDGRLPPLVVRGSRLEGIRYELPVASAQVKSCLLLAGLLAGGETVVVERQASRDHTERMLAAAGAAIGVDRERPRGGVTVSVRAAERLESAEIDVPGDFSSAAFFVVAATLVPGSDLVVRGVGLNPTRTGLLRVMRRMGADLTETLAERDGDKGEQSGELAIRHAPLTATSVEAHEVPMLIDELPLVGLLGALADGTTVVSGAAELRHKESDRIATVVAALRALGADAEATDDGFRVEGSATLRGGIVESAGDHRLAMLGAVAGLASRDGVEVRGFEAAAVSYPAFGSDLDALARWRRID